MEIFKIDRHNTKLIAHRGFRATETENTMAAFIAAGNRDFFGIECDIHKTRDGIYVVNHDDDLTRLTGSPKIIAKCNYDELIAEEYYDVDTNQKKPYIKIPKLTEYIECCKRYKKVCVIEFKNKFTDYEIAEVIKIAESMQYLDNCIFIAFCLENLLTVKSVNPLINVQLLAEEYDSGLIELCVKNNFDIDIQHTALTKEMLQIFHLNNIKVNVWSVNEVARAMELIDWGVDFITTGCLY